MQDNQIVVLYWARNEQAIDATAKKYGRYCYRIAFNILSNNEDANESVNDTYMGAWKSMPPHRPSVLSTFLGKLTRRISLNKWRNQNRTKRGGGEVLLALDELSECIPSQQNPERTLEIKELAQAINLFVGTLQPTERDIFVSRYWFLASIKEISLKFEYSESKTKSILFRTRKKLMNYLLKEGLV
jgi:RNA polymerase sigma-70 factor (ECF subfamily)